MTFDQFIAKYNGADIDFDGAYRNQCMDLYHYYLRDVLGIADQSLLRAAQAKLLWNLNSPLFIKIKNTPTGVPLKGDIMILSTPPDGHVCIFFSGDQKQCTSLDANWPLKTLTHLQRHDYKDVIGWLRFAGVV